eukprot:TRINITY_DN36531_c0_g1_i1.p1 TRINITY_DN36531_c0_g1~~TRINITY_DN36531_c0_g1_i1.p1  ORF type:complete len:120 (-),score=10.76 TRINITY_DN36531_c0_g1_i1:382-741(-)
MGNIHAADQWVECFSDYQTYCASKTRPNLAMREGTSSIAVLDDSDQYKTLAQRLATSPATSGVFDASVLLHLPSEPLYSNCSRRTPTTGTSSPSKVPAAGGSTSLAGSSGDGGMISMSM